MPKQCGDAKRGSRTGRPIAAAAAGSAYLFDTELLAGRTCSAGTGALGYVTGLGLGFKR